VRLDDVVMAEAREQPVAIHEDRDRGRFRTDG
jgi:hypothetical protein